MKKALLVLLALAFAALGVLMLLNIFVPKDITFSVIWPGALIIWGVIYYWRVFKGRTRKKEYAIPAGIMFFTGVGAYLEQYTALITLDYLPLFILLGAAVGLFQYSREERRGSALLEGLLLSAVVLLGLAKVITDFSFTILLAVSSLLMGVIIIAFGVVHKR